MVPIFLRDPIKPFRCQIGSDKDHPLISLLALAANQKRPKQLSLLAAAVCDRPMFLARNSLFPSLNRRWVVRPLDQNF